MTALFTIFGKTRDVPVVTFTGGKRDEPAKAAWDDTLWIERPEDWYALIALGGKTVRVVERDSWLRSERLS